MAWKSRSTPGSAAGGSAPSAASTPWAYALSLRICSASCMADLPPSMPDGRPGANACPRQPEPPAETTCSEKGAKNYDETGCLGGQGKIPKLLGERGRAPA